MREEDGKCVLSRGKTSTTSWREGMGRKREEETMRDGERHRDRRGREDKGESERDNRKRGNEYEYLPSGNCCSIWLEHRMKTGTYNKR